VIFIDDLDRPERGILDSVSESVLENFQSEVEEFPLHLGQSGELGAFAVANGVRAVRDIAKRGREALAPAE
jgi:hypothetical protein